MPNGRWVVSWEGLTLLKTLFFLRYRFSKALSRHKHLPSTSRYVLTDTHLYVSRMVTVSITAKKLFLFCWRICRFSDTLSPASKFGRICVDHCLMIYLRIFNFRVYRRGLCDGRYPRPGQSYRMWSGTTITLYSYNM